MGLKLEFITVQGRLHGNFKKIKNTEINHAITPFLAKIKLFD